jgi:hypothetical protein
MSPDRRRGRRADRRAFRPELEGRRLEPRLVLSAKSTPFVINQYILTHPQSAVAKAFNRPQQYEGSKAFKPHGPTYDKGVVVTQSVHGGNSVIIAQPDGSRFRVSLVYADNQFPPALTAETSNTAASAIPSSVNTTYPVAGLVQPQGTVRAYAMPGGKVGIIVDGSTTQMQLNIDPLPFSQRKGYAHSFAYAEAGRSHILNIGSLNITSGQIQAILGFHSADLSGPLVIGGDNTVDRIAFTDLLPGASIGVAGSLNTLDIYGNVNLTSGPGIQIGRDLNLFNAGGNVTFANGASFVIDRFVGLLPQPPKGTGTGSNILSLNQSLLGTGTSTVIPSVSANIQGNFTVGPGSAFFIGSGVANSSATSTSNTSSSQVGGSPSPFVISGTLSVPSRATIQVPNAVLGTSIVTVIPVTQNGVTQTVGFQNNIIARNGIVFTSGT